MSILKKIREQESINGLFRGILKKTSRWSVSTHAFLINRWPPSGVSDCRFGPYRFKYFNHCDDGIPQYFYYELPYPEQSDLKLFTELSKKSANIVDVGANTGLFSVLAGIANPEAVIHAFEPYSVNAARMLVNLDLNGAKKITVHEMAVGETDGEIEISVPKNKSITDVSSVNKGFSKQIYPEVAWDSQSVKITTLDSFAHGKGFEIDLIKCDVETFEMSVFKGMDKVLAESRPTVLFECFLDEERKSFFNGILAKYNYYVYLIMAEGVVYASEGFMEGATGLNYLITPVKPSKTFISFNAPDELQNSLLLRPRGSAKHVTK